MFNESLPIKVHSAKASSKEGRSFFLKIEKIEKLKQKNKKLECKLSEIKLRLLSEMGPTTKGLCDVRFRSLTALDAHIESNNFNKMEKEEIKEIIIEGALGLINDFMDERGHKFLNKYEEKIKEKEENLKSFQDMFRDSFDFLDDSESEKYEGRFLKDEERKIKRELKEKSLLDKTDHESKLIYRGLMKKLHPDLEQDEFLKKKKEELSKEITAAYEDKDMYQLLKLRSKYLDVTIDQANDLDIYLKGLNNQIKKLKSANKEIKASFGPIYENIYSTSKKMINKNIKSAVKEASVDVENEELIFVTFSDKKKLKKHLKKERDFKESYDEDHIDDFFQMFKV